MDDHVTQSMITTMNSSTFTGLPDDTQFNITVSGIGVMQDNLTFDRTSVRTAAFESKYVLQDVATFLNVDYIIQLQI